MINYAEHNKAFRSKQWYANDNILVLIKRCYYTKISMYAYHVTIQKQHFANMLNSNNLISYRASFMYFLKVNVFTLKSLKLYKYLKSYFFYLKFASKIISHLQYFSLNKIRLFFHICRLARCKILICITNKCILYNKFTWTISSWQYCCQNVKICS